MFKRQTGLVDVADDTWEKNTGNAFPDLIGLVDYVLNKVETTSS